MRPRQQLRALYKNVGYRVLDVLESIHARVTRRAWYTPGASAVRQWLRAVGVSSPRTGILAGQDVVSLMLQDGVVLSGPAEQSQWNSNPVRVARIERIARAAGVDVTGFSPAHFALLDNIVNRYIGEFCTYPYQSLRTMNLLPGDVFVDIGAFRGYVAVKAARKVGEGGRVYAVEPIDENFGFVKHHRDVNRLENVTALRAAVTSESETDTVAFFRTENQGNATIKDHLRGEAEALEVANLSGGGLVDMIRSEMPEARRIVFSLTTNGTELAVTEALMKAFEGEDPTLHLEVTIPVIFTASEVETFAASVDAKGWRSDLCHPWMRLWRPAETD